MVVGGRDTDLSSKVDGTAPAADPEEDKAGVEVLG
jgi:hypothetical protein